jgi:hypothetical protein
VEKLDVDKLAAFGDRLWEVFVVQLAAALNRVTLRRLLERCVNPRTGLDGRLDVLSRQVLEMKLGVGNLATLCSRFTGYQGSPRSVHTAAITPSLP